MSLTKLSTVINLEPRKDSMLEINFHLLQDKYTSNRYISTKVALCEDLAMD